MLGARKSHRPSTVLVEYHNMMVAFCGWAVNESGRRVETGSLCVLELNFDVLRRTAAVGGGVDCVVAGWEVMKRAPVDNPRSRMLSYTDY